MVSQFSTELVFMFYSTILLVLYYCNFFYFIFQKTVQCESKMKINSSLLESTFYLSQPLTPPSSQIPPSPSSSLSASPPQIFPSYGYSQTSPLSECLPTNSNSSIHEFDQISKKFHENHLAITNNVPMLSYQSQCSIHSLDSNLNLLEHSILDSQSIISPHRPILFQ